MARWQIAAAAETASVATVYRETHSIVVFVEWPGGKLKQSRNDRRLISLWRFGRRFRMEVLPKKGGFVTGIMIPPLTAFVQNL